MRSMPKLILPALVGLLLCQTACDSNSGTVSIQADQVTDGPFTARALNEKLLQSDYPLDRDTSLQQPIVFKLSLNGEDNEAGFGINHYLTIPPGVTEFYAPTLQFGRFVPLPDQDYSPLTAPVNVHFRVDLHAVLSALRNRGFYVTARGDTVAHLDFRGLFMAGGTPPLSWSWGDTLALLPNRFTATVNDSLFELTVRFIPPMPDKALRTWSLTENLAALPQFTSSTAPLLEALTNLALEEAIKDLRPDGSFSAGAAWPEVWTRDISYASQLSLAYFFPENVKHSLRAKLAPDGRIIQDTGTGGSWPVSSDRHLWTLAAWEVYLATGDSAWLAEIKQPVIQALKEDMLWNRDPVSGMLRGETSFEDWREQTYPNWMTPADIQASQALSTNVIFKRALEIGLQLVPKNTAISNSWPQLINRLDRNLLHHFWSRQINGPAAYVITTPAYEFAAHRDLLGESLAILYCSSYAAVDSMLVSSYPRTRYGSPVLSAQLPQSPPYHSQAIWPFVEAYALLAARESGNEAAYYHSFEGLIRAAAMFLSHRENYHYLTGRPDQTLLNSERQLWSIAGWLAAITKGLFGVSVQINYATGQSELLLQPDNPFPWQGFTLKNFKLQQTVVNIELQGFGRIIDRMLVNGEPWEPGKGLPLTGTPMDISITLTPHPTHEQNHLTLSSRRQPSIPQSSWTGDTLSWHTNDTQCLLLHNGSVLDTLEQSPVIIADSLTGFFSLRSLDQSKAISLPSQAHYQGAMATLMLQKKPPYYIELGKQTTFIRMSFSLPETGNYLLRFIYSNGSGPVNTGNTCGLAKLTINDWWLEQMISFPHTGSVAVWQNSSWYQAHFRRGKNTLTLDQEALPVTNMNGQQNLFRVRALEVIPTP